MLHPIHCHALPCRAHAPNVPQREYLHVHVCVLGGGVGVVVEANVPPVARLGACQGISAGQGPARESGMTSMARLGSLSFFPATGRLFLLGRRGGPPTTDLVVGPRHPFHAMANPFSVGCYSGWLLGQQRAALRYSLATGRSRASGGRGSSPGRVRWLDPAAAGQGTTGWEAISSDATMGTSDRGNPGMHTPGNWVASPANSSGGEALRTCFCLGAPTVY